MSLIRINGTLVINTEAIAFVRSDSGIDGKLKLRVVYHGGAELLLTGAAAGALLGHLESCAEEPRPAPGLRTGEDHGL